MALPESEILTGKDEPKRWYRTYAMIIGVICLGLLLTLSAYFVVRRVESLKLETEFHLHAQEHVDMLKRALEINFEALRSVGSFFNSTRNITREEFHALTKDMLTRNASFQAIEWIPRVEHNQRGYYERFARIEGFKDFTITERRDTGEIVRAGERSEYYPVYYVAPHKGNEIVLGYDLASNPVRWAALEKARDSGQMAVTARITLVQETGNQFGFLVVLPVYAMQASLDTIEARREHLIGFVLGAYQVGRIVENAFKHSEGLVSYIYDRSGPESESFLAAFPARKGSGSNRTVHEDSIKISHSLEVADRQWEVICEFTPEFAGYIPMSVSSGVVAGGLLFTALLAVYFTTNIRRTIQIKNLAERLSKEAVERRQAGEALRASEEKYRNILENIEEGYYETDLSGNYTFCNDTMCKISGCSRDKFVGMNYRQFMTPETARNVYEVFNKVYRKGKPSHNIEWETIRLDGSKRYLEISTSLIRNSQDRPIGFRGVVRDVTSRRIDQEEKERLEAKLQQSQKMEAIGTLAGGIAHDFNNILTSIIGYADLSLIHAEKGSQLEEHIKEVIRAGKRATDLVRQILAFSRQGVQELKPIMPSLVIKEAIKLLRSATPTTIDVRQNIASDSLIMGDQTRIHQVLMNLCTNAVHAMEASGGTLQIDLSDVSLDESFTSQFTDLTPGNYLKLTVSDTGKGIDPDIIGSIFEPYFTTKEPGEGTGLGLSVVQGIIKDLKGEVTVASAPGRGSTFTVYLPLLEKKLALEPERADVVPAGKERILLVDDEAAIVNMCRQILAGLGYSVTTRTSSVESLELFRNRPDDFDLVLTDMTMPNMTGEQLAHELKKIRPDIPVILCTGYSKNMSQESAARIGIKAFVMKPFFRSELARTIRNVLDHMS
ncbi:MAG: CHASE domain-containing protein [Thermodesulfobacteriota bacterium]